MLINGEQKTGVYVAGAFDMLHYGHVRFLERARKLGDILYVGLCTDEAIKEVKGHYPILNYSERWEMLRALKCVSGILKQDSPYPMEVFKKLKEDNLIFDILVRADDVSLPIPGQEFMEANGGKVVLLPYTKEITSSDIKKRIINKG